MELVSVITAAQSRQLIRLVEMAKRMLGLLCAIAVSCLSDRCAYMSAHWPRQLNLSSLANEFHQHTEASAGTTASSRLPAVRAHKESLPEPAAAVAPRTAVVAPTGATLSPSTTTMTLSSDGLNRTASTKSKVRCDQTQQKPSETHSTTAQSFKDFEHIGFSLVPKHGDHDQLLSDGPYFE